MNCPVCGDPCRCSPEPEVPATSRRTPDADTVAMSAAVSAADSDGAASTPSAQNEENSLEASASSGHDQSPAEESSAWRDELSARLNQYRSRRKPAPPRYPSLRLPFDEPSRTTAENSSGPARPPAFETVSNRALALDFSAEVDSAPSHHNVISHTDADSPSSSTHTEKYASAKIIEFPRPAEMPPRAPSDELADPVFDRPRILEVPDVVPPPPALGGINMEAVQVPDLERRPGIDVPVHSPSLTRRMIACAIDAVVIAAASALFGWIFWKITAYRPPPFQLLGLGAGIPALLWAAYQYLLVVYSGGTPGIRLAGLHLERFDGTLTNRRLRRWRVLASFLSAVSLGLGYAWVLLDEDSLCWHDRITHSYLATKKR